MSKTKEGRNMKQIIKTIVFDKFKRIIEKINPLETRNTLNKNLMHVDLKQGKIVSSMY